MCRGGRRGSPHPGAACCCCCCPQRSCSPSTAGAMPHPQQITSPLLLPAPPSLLLRQVRHSFRQLPHRGGRAGGGRHRGGAPRQACAGCDGAGAGADRRFCHPHEHWWVGEGPLSAPEECRCTCTARRQRWAAGARGRGGRSLNTPSTFPQATSWRCTARCGWTSAWWLWRPPSALTTVRAELVGAQPLRSPSHASCTAALCC